MQRRYFLFLAPLLPSAFFAPRLLRAYRRQNPPRPNVRDTALRIDELASNIHTPEDARRLIDFLADLFADDLPPAWTTRTLRSRLAQGEYLTVTNPQKLISEEHLAEAWNTYLTTIQASDDSPVSAAEIHNLRDALYATTRVTWNMGGRNFWLVPSLFAAQPDHTLAPACRVVESLRIFYDLYQFPDNLQAARERVAKGILVSDQFKQALQNPSQYSTGPASISVRGGISHTGRAYNPAEAAALRERSIKALTQTVETLLNTVLSA